MTQQNQSTPRTRRKGVRGGVIAVELLKRLLGALGWDETKLEMKSGLNRRTMDKVMNGKPGVDRSSERYVREALAAEGSKRGIEVPSSLYRLADDIGRHWTHIVPSFTRNQSINELLEIVNRGPGGGTLFASIGEGSGLVDMLTGIPETRRFEIDELVVWRVSPRLVTGLAKHFATGFDKRLKSNLDRVKQWRFKGRSVKLTIKMMNGLPPFHGFLYGDDLYWGRWTVNDNGHLTVDNQLMWHLRRGYDPEFDRYAAVLRPSTASGISPITKSGARGHP